MLELWYENPAPFEMFLHTNKLVRKGLAAGYAIPITVSMLSGRVAVSTARFRLPAPVGWTVNILGVLWVAFQLVLFSMPTALPVTTVSMNYASVVLVGFMFLSTVYYLFWARKGESVLIAMVLFPDSKTVLQSMTVPRSLMDFEDNQDGIVLGMHARDSGYPSQYILSRAFV